MSIGQRAFFSTLLAALLAPARTEAQSQRTVLDQNIFVRDTLREMYLWYQTLPDLDPALYPSPEAYLDAVRLRPQDESFSYVSSAEATSFAFIS